jgi:hypothetical protein
MGHYQFPFGNRDVVKSYILKEIKEIAENCDPGIGLPASVVAKVSRKNPGDPYDKAVTVEVAVDWG